ncbi:MAG: hypothetical protein CM1200mP26_12070 [Acidimicrobiales bacterium]|nr:MAG: hypothetical protein CM1200mP26_12070 [Acidimicrobiales bacterium]
MLARERGRRRPEDAWMRIRRPENYVGAPGT